MSSSELMREVVIETISTVYESAVTGFGFCLGVGMGFALLMGFYKLIGS